MGWKEGSGLTGDFQPTDMILTREFEAELLRIISYGDDFYQLIHSFISTSSSTEKDHGKQTFKSTHSPSPFNVISGGPNAALSSSLTVV